MGGADQQHGGVGEELGQHELVVVDPLPLVVPQEGHGDLALLQHAHQMIFPAAVDGQRDVGVELAVSADRQGQERAADRGKGPQGDTASTDAGDVREIRLRSRQLPEDLACVCGQHQACVGRCHAAGMAVEERLSSLALQPQELLGDRGWRVAQRGSGAGDGPFLHDRQQDLEPLDVEHAPSLHEVVLQGHEELSSAA